MRSEVRGDIRGPMDVPRVLFTEPPPEHRGPFEQAALDLASTLPKDAKGAAILVANETQGNVALVHKTDFGEWELVAGGYVGKVWRGSTHYGAQLQLLW